MRKNNIHSTIQAIALALVLFTFPFRPLALNNLSVVLLSINWLIEGNFQLKFQRLLRSKIALLYAGLYVILLISCAVSTDKIQGLRILERNLLLLVIPIILATSNVSYCEAVKALYAFVAGCFLASVICLTHATYQYFVTGDHTYFFYHNLSKPVLGLHAIYFSLYLGTCVLFLVMELNTHWMTQSRFIKATCIGLIITFYSVLLLLSSKTIIVTLTIFLNCLFLIWAIKKSKKVVGILAVLLVNITLIVGVLNLDYVKKRFENAMDYNMEFIKRDTYSHSTVFTGLTLRVTLWKFVLEILDNNNSWWTGVGIGDADSMLNKKAAEENLFTGNEELGQADLTSYNAHNQYVQYLLSSGIPGFVYFLLILFAILYHAICHRKALLFFSTLLFMAFCFTESALAVYKGIIFFSTIIPMLIYGASRNQNI